MFVTFEGVEGAGKSTVAGLAAEMLAARGERVVLTREPGSSSLGRKLRAILLDARNADLDPIAELHLFLADRAQHIAEIVRPALEEGKTALCDRYTDSTIAYQGYGRGADIEKLEQLCAWASGGLEPDLTLLLDLPVARGLQRAGMRNKKNGAVISEGRFDSESVKFHERVRAGYLDLARKHPRRIKIVNAEQTPESAAEECLNLIFAAREEK